MSSAQIAGYTFGAAETPRSPLSMQDFELLRKTVLFTDDDIRYLQQAGQVLDDQVEDVLDLWYGFVASHPHLVYYFSDPRGNPIPEYLAAVRGALVSGSATRVPHVMTRPGSTINRKSRCVIRVRRRIKQTKSIPPPATFRCDT